MANNNHKKLLLFTVYTCTLITLQAQDSIYARKMLNKLCSKAFFGRGYTANGLGLAKDFIKAQFAAKGLLPLNGESYEQEFRYAVNTFPTNMSLTINGKKLTSGKGFIINPASVGLKAKGLLNQIDSAHFEDRGNNMRITLKNKLTWSAERETVPYTELELDTHVFKEIPKDYAVNIENVMVPDFHTANLCAYVKGTSHPDSFLMITAHYDHLGSMGARTYFPGANDNASGVSILLTLAAWFSKHPLPYSVGFLAFSGEEAGLIGSRYYTENPLFPLEKIKFLINLDLEGTGNEGAMVVNATEYKDIFEKLETLNNAHHYLPAIFKRGKAANSDHYFFTEKGVPSFFMYTLGGIKAYHDVFDRPETLPFHYAAPISKMVIEFFKDLSGLR